MAGVSKIWAEAWTLPGSPSFQRVRGPVLHKGLTYERKFRDFGSGSFTVGAHYSSHLDILDPANNIETLIRVFENGKNVHDFFARSLDKDFSHDGDITISGPGLKDELDKVIVYPFDWSGVSSIGGISQFANTIYGGENILKNASFEDGLLPEVQAIGHNFTGGTFTLTFDGQTTVAINWNASSTTVEEALENLSNITDVDVTGGGEYTDPWRIEFINPLETDVVQLILNSSLTGPAGSTYAVQTWQVGGAGNFSPWTRNINPVNGIEHGLYDGMRVAFDYEPAPVITGTRSLKLNLNPGGTFGGTQQGVDVVPGGIYQASVWVYTPDFGQTFRLGIRGAYDEFYISTSTDTLIPQNTWVQLSIANVAISSFYDRVLFRVACVSPNSDTIFFVEDAFFAPGLAPQSFGQIILNLRTTAIAEDRDVVPWLDMTSFTGAVDSNGTPWINMFESIEITAGQSWMQVIEEFTSRGYESDIRWDPIFGSYRLYLYNPLGQGQDISAQDFPRLAPPRVAAATVRKVSPKGNTVLASGEGNMWLEGEDLVFQAAYGRREVFESSTAADFTSLQEVIDNRLDLFDAEKVGVKFNVDGSIGLGPGLNLDIGDSVQTSLQGELAPEVLRVYGFHVTVDENMNIVKNIDVGRHILKEPFGGTTSSSSSAAINYLLREFKKRPKHVQGSSTAPPLGRGGAPTVVVASIQSTAYSKQRADFFCTGVDDHVIINQALAVCEAGGYGGTVWLCEGGYYCEIPATDAAIVVPVGVKLCGVGHGMNGVGASLEMQNLTDPGRQALIRMKGHSEVHNLTLYAWDSAIGIQLTDFNGFQKIVDSWIETDNGACIEGNESHEVWVERNMLWNRGNPASDADSCIHIYGNNTVGWWVNNNWIINGYHGIFFDGDQGLNFIHDNHIEGTWYSGIRLKNDVNPIFASSIIGNLIQQPGIDSDGTSGDACIYISSDGADVDPTTAQSNGVLIADNKLEIAAATYGIRLSDCCLITVHDNYLEQQGLHGIYLENANANQIHDNLIQEPNTWPALTYDGIFLEGSDDNYIRMNTLIEHRGGSPTYYRYAINVSDAASNNNVIVGNNLRLAGSGTGFINDAGTGTILTWPAGGAGIGDNFT